MNMEISSDNIGSLGLGNRDEHLPLESEMTIQGKSLLLPYFSVTVTGEGQYLGTVGNS